MLEGPTHSSIYTNLVSRSEREIVPPGVYQMSQYPVYYRSHTLTTVAYSTTALKTDDVSDNHPTQDGNSRRSASERVPYVLS